MNPIDVYSESVISPTFFDANIKYPNDANNVEINGIKKIVCWKRWRKVVPLAWFKSTPKISNIIFVVFNISNFFDGIFQPAPTFRWLT